MATEQLPGDQTSKTQEEQPSFLNKVKAKAKKLQSKIKHHGTAQEAPTSGEPNVKPEARGTTDMDLDQSDTSESDGEGKNDDIPYMPMTHTGLSQPMCPAGAIVQQSQGSPFGAVSSGQSGYGTEGTKSTDKSFSNDPTVLKSEGPAETEQAVRTNYNYFNANPEEAYRPSDDAASQSKEEVPSILGGEPVGLTPLMERLSVGSENSLSARDGHVSMDRATELARSFGETQDSHPTAQDGSVSMDRDTELARSFGETQESKQKADDGLVELSKPSEESLLSHLVEQDQGVEKLPSHSLTPLNSLQDEGSEYAGLGSQDEALMGYLEE